MVKNKPTRRQHYIPQFYLKNFALTDNRLNVFSLVNEKCHSTAIKNIAKEDFYYGNDEAALKLESGLSKHEGKHSAILKKIIDNYNLNRLDNDDYTLLHVYTLFQEARSKSSKLFSIYFTNTQNADGKPDINTFKKSPRNFGKEMGHQYRTAFGRILQAPILSYEGISDLQPALIINTTDNNFICSDAPTVRFNQLKIENERLMSLFSPGLQIFYPINNEILLLFYDPKAYQIDFDYNSSICYIDTQTDLDSLNKLQLINANDFILFSDINQKENIEYIYSEIKTIIQKNTQEQLGSFEKGKKFLKGLDDNYWNIWCSISKYFNYRLNLSFIHPCVDYEQYWLKKYYSALERGIKPELVRNNDLKKRIDENIKKAVKHPRSVFQNSDITSDGWQKLR